MSRLAELRDAIKDQVKAGMSDLVAVYTHGGALTEEELNRVALKAPCAVVTCLRVNKYELQGGARTIDLHWATYLVAKDQPRVDRDRVALALVEAALGVIHPEQDWGFSDEAHAPENIRAGNLFSGKTDQKGVSLWAITWSQGWDLVTLDPSDLDDFLRYRSTTQLSDDAAVPTADDAVDFDPED